MTVAVKVLFWVRHNMASVLGGVSVVLMVVVVLGLGNIVNRQHSSDLETCARSNDSRVSSIEDKRIEVRAIEKESEAWELVLALTPRKPDPTSQERRILKGFNGYINALNQEARDKKGTIRSTIAAQKDVAIHPGSPIVDCDAAFP